MHSVKAVLHGDTVASMRIAVRWNDHGGVLVANLLGRIDSGNAGRFQELLEAGIDSRDRVLVLNFERVSFISSAGLRACVIVAKGIRRLAFCSMSGFNREIVAVSGLDQMIEVFDSQIQAVRSLGEDGEP